MKAVLPHKSTQHPLSPWERGRGEGSALLDAPPRSLPSPCHAATLLGCVLALLLAGCATSTEHRGQDGWANYEIGCSGPLLNLRSCLAKAGEVCRGRGYKVLDYEGVQPPASTTALPPPGLIEQAIRGELNQEALNKFEIRKLYIRCH